MRLLNDDLTPNVLECVPLEAVSYTHLMAGRRFSIRSLPVTDGGYEVEPGMIDIAMAQPKGSVLGHVAALSLIHI